MTALRVGLWALVAIVAALVAWLSVERFGTSGERARAIASMTGFGGPFQATLARAGDPTGKPITQDDWLGRPHAVFFGFTHCPDICPTTLFEAGRWLDSLGEDAAKLDVYFVTVDPARDTAAHMADYLRPFDPRIAAVTGSEEQIARIAKAWRVVAERVELEDGDYTMNHTATVFLMDADGGLQDVVSYGASETDALAKLRRLTGS